MILRIICNYKYQLESFQEFKNINLFIFVFSFFKNINYIYIYIYSLTIQIIENKQTNDAILLITKYQ